MLTKAAASLVQLVEPRIRALHAKAITVGFLACLWGCADAKGGASDATALSFEDAAALEDATAATHLDAHTAPDASVDDGATATLDDGGLVPCQMACTHPTPPVCISDTILRENAPEGVCLSGACWYAAHDVDCPFACREGTCLACAPGEWSLGATAAIPLAASLGSAIVLDDVGTVHVFGGTSRDEGFEVRHLTRAVGATDWTREVIEAPVSTDYYDAAITRSGALHVVYVNPHVGPNGTLATGLRYATRASPQAPWIITMLVDQNATPGRLVIDQDDHVLVTYGENDDTKFARIEGGALTGVELVTTASGRASIAIGADNAPSVAYRVGDEVRVATRSSSGVWMSSPVATGPGDTVVLTVDSSGDLHIAYVLTPPNQTRRLMHATRDANGAWSSTAAEVSLPISEYVSLAVDVRGKVMIAFGSIVVEQTRPAGPWTRTFVPVSNPTASDMTLSPNGDAYVVYSTVGPTEVATRPVCAP